MSTYTYHTYTLYAYPVTKFVYVLHAYGVRVLNRTLRYQASPLVKEKFNVTIRNIVDVEAGDNLCSFLELMGYRCVGVAYMW